MSAFRVLYRSTLLFTILLSGVLLTVLFQKGAMPRQSLSSKITCWWHRKMTKAFGVPVRVYGTPSQHTTLFIANHISWFDINALGSTLPARFLSKAEVRKMPLMGWLASRAGTLYIPRGGKLASKEAIEAMVNALQQDHHVVLFAEGTTSDGKIKRFHSRLVQSAIDAGCYIQPVAIRYPSSNGEHVHPDALFVGDISMGQSVAAFMKAKDLVAELHFLDPVPATGKSRDELAALAESEVRRVIENAAGAK